MVTLNKVIIDVGKKEFSQASHLWPALELVSSKTVHMQRLDVCEGFMSLIRFSQTMHIIG